MVLVYRICYFVYEILSELRLNIPISMLIDLMRLPYSSRFSRFISDFLGEPTKLSGRVLSRRVSCLEK